MKPDPLHEKLLNREHLFSGGYLSIDRLNLEFPDGKIGFREVVLVKNAAAIIPIDKDGTVHLVRQHRACIGKTILEVPAGIVDSDNEPVEECAIRECEEEIGIKPKKLIKLKEYAHAEGYSSGFITLFLGLDLEHTGKINLDYTEYNEKVEMKFSKLLKMVEKNEIIDSKTMLCTLLAKPFVNSDLD